MAHIPGSRGVLDNGLNLSIVVAEANVVGAVLLHGDGSLKGSISHSERDASGRGLLDDLTGLVIGVACYHLSVDLE